MLRALVIFLFAWVAFDHFVGDDKGALFLTALISHPFH